MAETHVLMHGVDTLVLVYRAPVPHETITALERAKALSKSIRDAGGSLPATVDFADREWVVQLVSPAPYRFLITRHEEMDVRVAGRSTLPGETPTVVVELRSALLWRLGYMRAAKEAQAVARALLGAPDEWVEQVARLDLCADFQGWRPTGTDEESEHFVRRVRKGWHRHGIGKNFTGYSVGLGLCFQARLYDKSEEIERSGKKWFLRLWARDADYDADESVWRLELQARGEWLKAVGARDDWFENASEKLDEVWRYAWGSPDWEPDDRDDEGDDAPKAFGDHGAWLSLRLPNGGKRYRWPIAPQWRELQSVAWTNDNAPRARPEWQREANIENLRAQVAGTLSSIAALAGVSLKEEADPVERNRSALYWAFDEFESRQLLADVGAERDFATRVREKRAAMPSFPLESRQAAFKAKGGVSALGYAGPMRPRVLDESIPYRRFEQIRPTQTQWFGDGPDAQRERRAIAKRMRFRELPHVKHFAKGGAK